MPEKSVLDQIKLTPAQTKSLQGMTLELNHIERELKKAELAGLDVSEARATFEDNKKKRSNLLKYYGSSVKD